MYAQVTIINHLLTYIVDVSTNVKPFFTIYNTIQNFISLKSHKVTFFHR